MEHYKFKVGDKIKKDGWGVLEWFEIKFIDIDGDAFGINQRGIGSVYYSSELDRFELYKEEPKFKEVTMYKAIYPNRSNDALIKEAGDFVVPDKLFINKDFLNDVIYRGHCAVGYIEGKVFLKDEGKK